MRGNLTLINTFNITSTQRVRHAVYKLRLLGPLEIAYAMYV